MKPPKVILFVCTGNTCRSPMAEYLLRQMLNKEGVQGIEVFSRGVASSGGWPMTEGAQKVMERIGVHAAAHRSARLESKDLERADLVLVMEEAHRQILLNQFPEHKAKVHRLKEYAGEGAGDVEDPLGTSDSIYEETRKEIENALLAILTQLRGTPSPSMGEGRDGGGPPTSVLPPDVWRGGGKEKP